MHSWTWIGIGLALFFTVISMFIRLRYVLFIYVVGNIALFFYAATGGVAGGYFVFLIQLPALIVSSFCMIIGQNYYPFIGGKLPNLGDGFLNKLKQRMENNRDPSALNLDGTPKACDKVKRSKNISK